MGGGFRRAYQIPEWDILQDEGFLESFYRSMPEERDPRQRFVVRMRYKGQEEHKLSRTYVEAEFLENFLGFPKEDILAVITPPGMREIDLCFTSESAYQRFWDTARAAFRIDATFLQEYSFIPLFRGETRVLTVSFRTTVIPEEDIAMWLHQRCKVLLELERKKDDRGYWTGEYRTIISLDRDPYTGQLRHLPKYFFMGADRGITRYSGQPSACFQCGAFDHIRKNCQAQLCSKCGTTGMCRREVTCSLCSQTGHAYRYCPESELNKRYPEAFHKEKERAKETRRKEEARQHRQGEGEVRHSSGQDERESQTEDGQGGRRDRDVHRQRQDPWETVNRRQRGGKIVRERLQEIRSQDPTSANRFHVLQGQDEKGTETEDNQDSQNDRVGGQREDLITGQKKTRKRHNEKNNSQSPKGREGEDPKGSKSIHQERKKVKKNPQTPEVAKQKATQEDAKEKMIQDLEQGLRDKYKEHVRLNRLLKVSKERLGKNPTLANDCDVRTLKLQIDMVNIQMTHLENTFRGDL